MTSGEDRKAIETLSDWMEDTYKEGNTVAADAMAAALVAVAGGFGSAGLHIRNQQVRARIWRALADTNTAGLLDEWASEAEGLCDALGVESDAACAGAFRRGVQALRAYQGTVARLLACPGCGESSLDNLVWLDGDEERVRCSTCRVEYAPGA